jgi:hypothetical protein
MGNQSNYASALNISQVNLIPTIHSGDPRSFSDYELFRYLKAETINSQDSTPAPCTPQSNQRPLGESAYTALSLGTLGLNINISLNSTMWRDVNNTDSVSANQTAVPFAHSQSILASVGQLGHVYDPTKYITSQDVLLYGRGGGRTLNIGQTEGTQPGGSLTSSPPHPISTSLALTTSMASSATAGAPSENSSNECNLMTRIKETQTEEATPFQ